MPQSPLASYPKVPDGEMAAGRARSDSTASASSATGSLPGGRKVKVQTMSRSELLTKKHDPNSSAPPIVEIRNCLGEKRYTADFDGTNFGVALDANPALRHLEEHPAVEKAEIALAALNKQKRAVEHMHAQQKSTTEGAKPSPELLCIEANIVQEQRKLDATRHVLQQRRRIGLSPRFGQILAPDSRYREPNGYLPNLGLPGSTQSHNAGQGRLLRDKRLLETVSHFLATAGLSSRPEAWCALDKDDLAATWRHAHYYVHQWEPASHIDWDSPEAVAQCDREISEDWKNGAFDKERGATFINFNQGRDWVVWPEHDRTTGYNLSQSCHVHATPSAMYRDLEKNDPAKLRGMDAIFVAPASAANTLSYLKAIPQAEAHRALASYCTNIGISVVDMDFDEFGRFMQSRYSKVVVARYDVHSLDAHALGSMLDASENNFILVNIAGDSPAILQDKQVSCFRQPGLKLSMNEERMKEATGSGISPPRSDKPRFESEGYTAHHFLQARRAGVFTTPLDAVNFRSSAKVVRSAVAGGSSKLYNPSDYSGNPEQFEMPSTVLRRYVDRGDQIGIVSVGDLGTFFATNEATLELMAESEQIRSLVDWFRFAGVTVESPSELARFVYKTHGVWTEQSVESMKRYVEHQNDTLPDNKKVTATLEVIRHGHDLPNVGDDPKGCLIQFLYRGKPVNLAFYKRGAHTLFRGVDGNEYLSAHLNAVARHEGWQREGPVSMLRFHGESVLPLVNVDAAQQEGMLEVEGSEDRKRKRRPLSTSSALSDIAMRPKPGKTGRFDSDTSDA